MSSLYKEISAKYLHVESEGGSRGLSGLAVLEISQQSPPGRTKLHNSDPSARDTFSHHNLIIHFVF